MTTVNVIVLAGGKTSPAMQSATGVANRALVPLGAGVMLDYVVRALRAAESVGRIFVVGDVPHSENYTSIAPGDTLMDNLLLGINAACQDSKGQHVLVSTSDIPFLTPASVDDFIAQSAAANADFCYPVIPIGLCKQAFPQMKRTALKLREGEFTGGNLMLVNPDYVVNQRETILRAYGARKRIGQIGAMLGWGLLVRIIAAQTVAPNLLTIPMLESGVARLLGTGCRAQAIITQYPEIGTDIDSAEDIAVAQGILGNDTFTPGPARTSGLL